MAEKGDKVQDEGSQTGVAGFDDLTGGGFPKGSVVLLTGSSGSGKTILSFQWLFEGVQRGENGLYITLTEPLFKILKNLEPLKYYDRGAIEDERLKIVDLRDFYQDSFDTGHIISLIERQVRETNAKRLCIDSITAIAYSIDDKAKIRKFIFELGKILATLGCTTILTSEVGERGKYSVYDVEEFISDAIIRLDQVKERGQLFRVMQIVKIRGRKYSSEELHFTVSERGIIVYPKPRISLDYDSKDERVSTGNDVIDKMLFGGLFRGSTTLIAGATGSGKSVMSMQFLIDGLRRGETCLYAGFEESREQLVRNYRGFGWDIEHYERAGKLIMRCVYPGDKLPEEHLLDLKAQVESRGVSRCAVDSLSALSNTYTQEEFTGFVKLLNGYLKKHNVTSFFTTATTSLIGGTTLSEANVSSLTDNIIMMRYVEMNGELKLVANVLKMRGSNHSKELREYKITDRGILIGQSLSGYEGVMSGVTRKVSESSEERLKAEFRRVIGPMADAVYLQLTESGISRESVQEYIDGLVKQGIIQKEDAEQFKRNVGAIMGSPQKREA